MTDLQLHWRDVTNLLLAAFDELPPSERVNLEFQHFLDHNELELAWDSLADVGTRHESATAFWLNLAEAASKMGLHEKVSEAIKQIRKASGLLIA